MKYRPNFPRQPFTSLEAARAWVADFVAWYNNEHCQSGIRYVTPHQRHEGLDKAFLEARHRTYQEAQERNPQRWTGQTRDWSPIETVVLNPAHDQDVVEAA